jgi:hypothetical protein
MTPANQLYFDFEGSACRKIPLSGDRYCIIEAGDYERFRIWKWRLVAGYVSRSTRVGGKNRNVSMHREILGLAYGDKRQGHHINHNPLDNRRSNLRIVTAQQNSTDQRKKASASGLKGASWRKDAKRWRASIMVNYRTIHLGYYDSAEAAHAAYRIAAVRYQGEFARFSN